MSDSTKRKQGGDGSDRPSKKNKSQWQTPARKSKMARLGDRDAILEVGDQGIWVTFARGMDRKAIAEFRRLCDELGKDMYDIAPPNEEDGGTGPEGKAKDDGGEEEEDEEEDIEASIKREMEGFKAKKNGNQGGEGQEPKEKKNFRIVRFDIECVFFVKTRPPVEPVEFCRRICADAKACTDLMTERKTKYINRLTPVVVMDKMFEKELERAARKALAPVFELKEKEEKEDAETANPESGTAGVVEGNAEDKPAYTYAIRHSIRNNTDLKYGDLIQQVASFVGPKHKVDLGKPDKVILVDVFQNFCGFSVVDGSDWEGFRKFNVNEVYKLSPGATGSATSEGVKKAAEDKAEGAS